MKLDFGLFFHRITVLPANKNSLADILGEDKAAMLKAIGRQALNMAITNALGNAVGAAETNLAALAVALKAHAKAALQKTSPEINAHVDAAIDEALKDVRGRIETGAALLIKAEALDALYRRLDL